MELISVITPCHRKQDLFGICNTFLRQSYPNKELILVVPDKSFIPVCAPNIYRYIHTGTVGDLRNHAIQKAKGDILCHMDSDDLYSEYYLQKSYDTLISTGAALVGLNKCVFRLGNKSWLYEYKGSQKLVLGATMCYWHSTWENHPFRSMQVGEDNVFCAMCKSIAYGDYNQDFIAIRHDNNTSHPNFNSSSFTRIK